METGRFDTSHFGTTSFDKIFDHYKVEFAREQEKHLT